MLLRMRKIQSTKSSISSSDLTDLGVPEILIEDRDQADLQIQVDSTEENQISFASTETLLEMILSVPETTGFASSDVVSSGDSIDISERSESQVTEQGCESGSECNSESIPTHQENETSVSDSTSQVKVTTTIQKQPESVTEVEAARDLTDSSTSESTTSAGDVGNYSLEEETLKQVEEISQTVDQETGLGSADSESQETESPTMESATESVSESVSESVQNQELTNAHTQEYAWENCGNKRNV